MNRVAARSAGYRTGPGRQFPRPGVRNVELSVIIPTQPRRLPKLRRLLSGLTGGARHPNCELILTVDALDERPIRLAQELLDGQLAVVGLTQTPAGQSPARRLAIESARGRWLLFLDDDMLPGCDLIEAHLRQVAVRCDRPTAWLGSCGWPPETVDSPWMEMVNDSPMVIPWKRMATEARLDYRSFITCHICVPSDLVRKVGSFDPRFAGRMHEDIELGWRLQQQVEMEVRPAPSATAWHDHPLTPEEYCRREWFAGVSARAAREINRPFHDETWGGFGNAAEMDRVLGRIFLRSAATVLRELDGWTDTAMPRPTAAVRELAYLAHLPLKRLLFAAGYTGRRYESLWSELQSPAGRSTATPTTAGPLNAPAAVRR